MIRIGRSARRTDEDIIGRLKSLREASALRSRIVRVDSSFANNTRLKMEREKQNLRHREMLLKHIIWFEYISFFILFSLLTAYTVYRFIHPDKNPILSDVALNTLVVGFFAEITGLVYIVAHYLWWRPKRNRLKGINK